jgi:phosphatidylserine/phosphatidylglycerophosphate/cardiolipin synthase-like enzyme
MRLRKLIYAFLILIFISGCDVLSDYANGKESTVKTIIKDSGSIDVYFCPHDNCTDALAGFLDSAEESIDCAFYELNLEKVIDVLKQKSKLISVRLVIDGDNAEEANNLSFVKYENRSSYMHNKFCIVDGKKISSGSMNPTVNCATKNNNNLVLIESSSLAKNYEEEFSELWNGVFGKGDKVKRPEIYLNGKLIENYFCPEDFCGYEIKKELENANKSIYFMTFSFTHDSIGNTILLKHQEGVYVKGIFENRGSGTEYSKYDVFSYQGIDVIKDKNKATMHHKVFVIDNSTVILGSFNPSKNADEWNDENVLIIHDPAIALKFMEEFEYVWNYGEE